jgi:hypothetical protein
MLKTTRTPATLGEILTKELMVIGKQKEEKIGGSWLLTEFKNLFEVVLNSGDVRLLVVGYSFADSHINEIIDRAVAQYGCKAYVWDPKHPLELLKENTNILNGLMGWEPRTIPEMMPAVPGQIQIVDEGAFSEFFHDDRMRHH